MAVCIIVSVMHGNTNIKIKEMKRTIMEIRKEKGQSKKQIIDANVTAQIPLAANAGRTVT